MLLIIRRVFVSRGLPKYFNVYDEKNQPIFIKSRAGRIARFLKISYTRLYDIANLERKVDGYSLTYYEEETSKPERFYCQCCRKRTRAIPHTIEDRKRGELKMCSDKCKQKMQYKLERMDEVK